MRKELFNVTLKNRCVVSINAEKFIERTPDGSQDVRFKFVSGDEINGFISKSDVLFIDHWDYGFKIDYTSEVV